MVNRIWALRENDLFHERLIFSYSHTLDLNHSNAQKRNAALVDKEGDLSLNLEKQGIRTQMRTQASWRTEQEALSLLPAADTRRFLATCHR